jgi:transcriptional regulator
LYIPSHFDESRVEVLHDLIRQHSLATLVTLGPDGLIANHIPLIVDPNPAPFGTLRGHLSKANNQWRDSLPHVAALAIFQGPSAYITPSWYPSKQETGRVVPTYN